MNSESSKASHPHRLVFNLNNIKDLGRGEKSVALSNFNIYYTLKNINSRIGTTNLKYQLQRGMIDQNYQMYHILYQIFKIN